MGSRDLLFEGRTIEMMPAHGGRDAEPQSWVMVPPYALEGLASTHWRERPQGVTVDRIVVHWGGRSPHHCFDSLQGARYGSHFAGGPHHIFQLADIEHKTHHAGWANDRSIGIDIAQWCCDVGRGDKLRRVQDLVGRRHKCYRCNLPGGGCRYGADYSQLKLIPTEAAVDQDFIIELEENTAKTVREFIEDLCKTVGIPYKPCDPERHYSQAEYNASDGPTIFGHHSISTSGKIDIRPREWWDLVFPEGAA